MSVHERLTHRWFAEIDELRALAARTDGRLIVAEATVTQVQLALDCISAFQQDSAEPTIGRARHHIALNRLESWPTLPVQAVHRHPHGIFHPNIAPAFAGAFPPADPIVAMQRLMGLLSPGVICYGQPSPNMHLVDVAFQVYNMLGFRFGAFAQRGEHLNVEAGRWAQAMLRDNRFPLERRPLAGGHP